MTNSCVEDGIDRTCIGGLAMAVPLTAPAPSKLRVEWTPAGGTGTYVVDECISDLPTTLMVERQDRALALTFTDVGAVAPQRFDLKVIDKRDCSGQVAVLVDVIGYPTPGAQRACEIPEVQVQGAQ